MSGGEGGNLIDALVARVKVVSATQLVPVFRVHHGHTSGDDTDEDPARHTALTSQNRRFAQWAR